MPVVPKKKKKNFFHFFGNMSLPQTIFFNFKFLIQIDPAYCTYSYSYLLLDYTLLYFLLDLSAPLLTLLVLTILFCLPFDCICLHAPPLTFFLCPLCWLNLSSPLLTIFICTPFEFVYICLPPCWLYLSAPLLTLFVCPPY